MFRKFLAVILIIIFIPIFVATLLFYSAKPTLLNPDFYKKQFDKNQVYTIIIDQGLPILIDQIGISKENSEGDSQTIITDIIKTTITPQWLKFRSEALLDGFYDYFTGKEDTINVKISFADLKQNLSQFIAQESSESFNNFPDEIDLNQLYNSPKNAKEKGILEKIRSVTIYHQAIPLALAIITTVFLILIGLVIFKPIKSVIGWVCNAVFIPSLLLFIISAIGYFAADKMNKSFFLVFGSSQLFLLSNEIFIKIIETPFFYKLLIYSSIFISIAIAGMIISYFMPKKTNNYN